VSAAGPSNPFFDRYPDTSHPRDSPSIRIRGRRGSADKGLGVAIIDPAQPPQRIVLALMGFRGWLDPFERQRFTLLADRLDARIVVPETPGCSRNRTRITWAQGRALLGGRFDLTARTMLAAARPHLRVKDDPPLHLLGYSLGASIAAAMFAAQTPVSSARSVTLVEPVWIREWPVGRLIVNTRTEDRRTPAYVARNARWSGAVRPSVDLPAGPRPRTHALSMLLQGNALRRGRIPADLARSAPSATAAVIAHGTDSLLCPPGACHDLVTQLQRDRRRVFDVPVPGGHGVWHSLDDVAGLAGRLREVWLTIE
jgi:hypothetical protein